MLGGAILSLCDYTGNWSRPYEERGYRVIRIDLKTGNDVRLLQRLDEPVRGILAAPDCGAFAVSGAQYWPAKDASGETLSSLALVDACLRAVVVYRETLAWWALENPVGRLRRYLGAPRYTFDPCDHGDPYTKKTLLWGDFKAPTHNRVEPIRVNAQGSWIQSLGGKSARTKELRSATPMGFANAFAEANP